jgi:hypothetical protein
MTANQTSSDTTSDRAKVGSGYLPSIVPLEIEMARRTMPDPAVRKRAKEIYENTQNHPQNK